MKMADGSFQPACDLQYSSACPDRRDRRRGRDRLRQRHGPAGTTNKQIGDRHGAYLQEALADGGFAKHQDIDAVSEQGGGRAVYAPVPEPRDPPQDRYAPHEGDRVAVAAWRARMATAEAQAIYRQSAATAECVHTQARST
jgi:hypothetical protein